ncbi:uncharacterized protein LOC135223947 [Macrobrachium nipponense]|uniref:uncharacterized protein LOC135223947 n=1 Tax=Macrobrachium nipponense TaxID=159736 RepID=UPI0030C862D2
MVEHGAHLKSQLRVLEMLAQLGDAAVTKSAEESVVFAPVLGNWLFTAVVMDNIDHNPSAAIATTSFHRTSISVFQHPAKDNRGLERQPVQFGPESVKFVPELPDSLSQISPGPTCFLQVLKPITTKWCRAKASLRSSWTTIGLRQLCASQNQSPADCSWEKISKDWKVFWTSNSLIVKRCEQNKKCAASLFTMAGANDTDLSLHAQVSVAANVRKLPNFQLTIRKRDGELWFFKPDDDAELDFKVREKGTPMFQAMDEIFRPFDEVNGPMDRFELIPADNNDPCMIPNLKKKYPYQYYLLKCPHHAVTDGFTHALFASHLLDILRTLIEGKDYEDDSSLGEFISNEEFLRMYEQCAQELLQDPEELTRVTNEVSRAKKKPLLFEAFPPPTGETPNTRHIITELDETSVKKIIGRCKERGITFGNVRDKFWNDCTKIQLLNQELLKDKSIIKQEVVRQLHLPYTTPEDFYKSKAEMTLDIQCNNVGDLGDLGNNEEVIFTNASGYYQIHLSKYPFYHQMFTFRGKVVSTLSYATDSVTDQTALALVEKIKCLFKVYSE